MESTKSNTPLPWIAGVFTAAVICPLVYFGWIKVVGADQMVPTIFMGVLVGAAFRFTARPVSRLHLKAAIALSAVGTVIGFTVGDYLIWTPFMLGEAIRRMLSLSGLLTIGLSIYLGYLVAWSGRSRTEPVA